MGKMRWIITKSGKRYDLAKENASDKEEKDAVRTLVNMSYAFANFAGLKPFLHGRYLGLIINLDLGFHTAVKPHHIDAIAEAVGVKPATALKHVRTLEKTGVLIKGKRGGEDVWSVNYVLLAEVTGIELISY